MILVTEWPEFAELDWKSLAKRMRKPVLVDGRNYLDPERIREAGFAYEGIGRSEAGAGHTGEAAWSADPVAEDEARHLMHGVEFADDALDALRGADAAVLVTEWSEFLELDPAAIAAAMKGSVLIDGRNALDPAALRAAGLTYEGIGRS